MKKLIVTLMFVLPTLSACGDTADVKDALFPGQDVYTVSEVLDNRNICAEVNWETMEDERGKTVVNYRCEYKGAAEFYAGRNITVDAVEEYHQWTLTDNGAVYRAGGVVYWTPEGKSVMFDFESNFQLDGAFNDALENKFDTFNKMFSARRYMPAESVLEYKL